jgi:hypothetical protein
MTNHGTPPAPVESTPAPPSRAPRGEKKVAFAKRFTSRNRHLKHALSVLSKDMQGSLGRLTTTIEDMDREGSTPDVVQLKQDLKEQISRLNEGMSLLGTMLETNSSEILKYVRKRRDPGGMLRTTSRKIRQISE